SPAATAASRRRRETPLPHPRALPHRARCPGPADPLALGRPARGAQEGLPRCRLRRRIRSTHHRRRIMITEDLKDIQLHQIFPSPTNPRKTFDDAKLGELAESIASKGLIQPIVVRPMANSNANLKTKQRIAALA